eukprot:m.360071 g.360071  ORF g.360071 m.360071 type:complete len:494 (+) comp16635_c0_seq1:62-1543(+)
MTGSSIPRTRLLIVVGGSGVGKTTLITAAVRQCNPNDFAFLPDTTTRSRNSDESESCNDKRFVSAQQFADLVYDHRFVTWSRNIVNGQLYGIELEALWDGLMIGAILVSTVDASNATRTLNMLGNPAIQALFRPFVVWIRPPSLELLEERLRKSCRGEHADEEMLSRLKANAEGFAACQKLESAGLFDAVITNGSIDKSTVVFSELCQELARHKKHLWLAVLSPFRPVVLSALPIAMNMLVWIFCGAKHCDRPRLRRHTKMKPSPLHGLGRSLELLPIAGVKPAVALWCIVALIPHASFCVWNHEWPFRRITSEVSSSIEVQSLFTWEWLGIPLLALGVAVWAGSILHNPNLSHSAMFLAFKSSVTHFALRWFGPVPLLALLTIPNLQMLSSLVALQGLVLACHWLIKGIFKRYAPSVDPSGHARVCLNTIVYSATLGPRLSPGVLSSSCVAIWVLLQICTVFVSRWTHHTLLDIVLGFGCVAPQVVLLRYLL